MTGQDLLPLDLQQEQRLSNFVVGDNVELMAALRADKEAFQGLWVYGGRSSGRSHLLRGRCLEANSARYVGCADFGDDVGALEEALVHVQRHGEVVAIDDIGRLLGNRALEEVVVGIYQRLIGNGGVLLASHTESSLLTRFVLPDLGSRMRAMMNFAIKPLDDRQKSTLLGQRAIARGFKISDAVLNYWLSRGPRDMSALLDDLETLDRATLQRKQRLTIPLLKQVLGY